MTLSSLSYGIAFHDTSLLKVLHIIFWTVRSALDACATHAALDSR